MPHKQERRFNSDLRYQNKIVLGSWVELPDSGDIGGVVTEHTSYVDGSERWSVTYWHNGEKRHVQVERREMRPAERKR